MNTKLTVILPVYNAMPYLPEAVESILRQKYADFTFIIVNDGSTDGSRNYLEGLHDPRLVLIHQSNAGQGTARNAAVSRCKSEYVALMDADDISLPDRFLHQVEYLDSHSDVVMLGTQFEILAGRAIQRALKAPIEHRQIESRLLQGQAGLCNPTLMFRTAAVIACGGYPGGYLGEDIDFCLRMCEQGQVTNLNRVLLQYRSHAAQTSLAKHRDVVNANRYSAFRAVCRRKGMPEPAFETFLRNASVVDRWRWSAEAWEMVQYRTGRIQMASGRPLTGFLRLAALGICRPYKTIGRVAQTIGMLLRTPAN